jgi:DNA-binding MarR family transcriptional regulator
MPIRSAHPSSRARALAERNSKRLVPLAAKDAKLATVQRSLGPTLDFMRTLWAVDHALLTTSEAMHRRLGVTGPQRLVIRIVGRFPGISAGDLAGILHLHPSTLTGVLKRLVDRRLLTRNQDARDSRRAVLMLTAKGRGLEGPKPGTVEAKIRDVLKTLDTHDVATTETVLRAVARALTAE